MFQKEDWGGGGGRGLVSPNHGRFRILDTELDLNDKLALQGRGFNVSEIKVFGFSRSAKCGWIKGLILDLFVFNMYKIVIRCSA